MLDELKHVEFLTYETVVINIHSELIISKYGGLPGIRDDCLLRSCIERPKHYYYYENYLIPQLAAAYLYCINTGHVFVDGNKRTALAASEYFLRVNGYELIADIDTLERLVLGVAKRSISLDYVCDFFSMSSVNMLDW